MLCRLLFAVSVFYSFEAAFSAPPGEPAKQDLTPFSFEDIFKPEFRPRSFSPSWIPGTDEFTYRSSDSGAVMRYNAENDTETMLFDNSTFNKLGTGTYFISPDQQFVLFAYDIISQWRHSFFAKYKILDISSSELYEFPNGSLAGRSLQFAGWSSTGHKLSFVIGNDLYYQTSPTVAPVRVTTDGDDTYIFNGVPDWLYEEDVLGDRVTHYWSPDDSYICYARINDTQVPLQSWPWYGPKTDVYGKIKQIAYPKAGDVRDGRPGPNSRAELFVISTKGSSSPKPVPPPSTLDSMDHYYVQVSWRNDSSLYVTWTNRVQNYSISTIYDVTATNLSPVTNLEYNVSGGWVEVAPPAPWFIDGGTRYLTIHPLEISAQLGTWRHLAIHTSPLDGLGSMQFLTNGTDEVQEILGYDEVRKLVYFQSTNGDPSERHVLRVGLPGASAADQDQVCLTCGYPVSCRFVTASFSSTGRNYVSICLGPNVPTFTLKSTVPEKQDKAKVMEDNSALSNRLSEKQMPERKFMDVSIGGGYTGKAEVFIPPNYVKGEKFPLLVYVYAGPGSQRVMKSFPLGSSTSNWLNYLKSSHRVVVASIDGRGSMAAGDKLKFEMYRKLGTIEVEDQILGGQDLIHQLDYIDGSKNPAIFGWSYGGGTTAHVMGNESTVFKCGVSVAPVTTKTYYDTAYTERYLALATPDDDELGYNNTDIMHKAANFKGKKFMISHGTADDNVHFMHTVQLINALANADVLFKSNLYMDQNHGINSPGQSRHLYHSMSDFLINDCWNLNARNEVTSSAIVISQYFGGKAAVIAMIFILSSNLF